MTEQRCFKEQASTWFQNLRDQITKTFEDIEKDYAPQKNLTPGTFDFTPWNHKEGGGGTIGLMKGAVFEKVGVNISTVYGNSPKSFADKSPEQKRIPAFGPAVFLW
jgi:coproporphyrinogen III oxidase